ncbi:MAG: gamma-glutamylcyclotransferase [Opitutales bacterium]|nr:gamma-glutamylcyclotransferase [Opitutales bacterium]
MLEYFAYGSNLFVPRLAARVPSARFAGVARLAEHRVVFHKRGADGSGKATLAEAPGCAVWGAVYVCEAGRIGGLRRAEGWPVQYRETEVEVAMEGTRRRVMTYTASKEWTDPGLRPFDWYLDLVLAGARASGLPPAYIAGLAAVPAVADPDEARARANRAIP